MQSWKQLVFVALLGAAVVALGAFSSRAHAAVIQLDQQGCESTASNVYQIAMWRDKGVKRAEVHKRIKAQRDEAVSKGMSEGGADVYARFLTWIADVVYDNPEVSPEALAVDFYTICINAGGRVDMGEST